VSSNQQTALHNPRFRAVLGVALGFTSIPQALATRVCSPSPLLVLATRYKPAIATIALRIVRP